MSIRQGRGMPSGPGGRKPRTSPLLVAVPLLALLVFNALTGRIDLTNAFDDEDIDGIVRRHLAAQATSTAQETAAALQALPPTATAAPITGTTEAEATPDRAGCEASGDPRYCHYTVESGDNLASIATRFGLDGGDVPGWELIFESNKPDLASLDEPLQIGTVLRIPNSVGVVHLVLPGDSVSGLAEAYDVTTADIVAANALADPNNVQIGDILLIPSPAQLPPIELPEEPEQEPAEGELQELPDETSDEEADDEQTETPADDAAGEGETESEANPEAEAEGGERTENPEGSASELRRDDSGRERDNEDEEQPAPEHQAPAEPDDASRMSWPVVQVKITNYMSARHPLGIDLGLGGAPNSPITAAAGGTVIFAGGDACCSYGYYVIVEHPNGLQTLYAHLSRIGVSKGQAVARGETLGIAGNTGNSRGVHLHFEVYRNGKRVDPMQYLPSP